MKTPIPLRSAAILMTALATVATATTFTVTDPGDTGLNFQLRWAINQANLDNDPINPTVIDFQVPNTLLTPPGPGGVAVIRPITPLPIIRNQFGRGILIDGFTQPGSGFNAGDPRGTVVTVELDGSLIPVPYVPPPPPANQFAHGLHIMSSNNIVQGMCVHSFPHDGISIQGIPLTPPDPPQPSGANNNQIRWNLVGTDVTGILAMPNGHDPGSLWGGIYIKVLPGSPGIANGNIVLENVASGNVYEGIGISNCPDEGSDVAQNHVERNLVGIDITGTNANLTVGNGHDGIYIGEGAHHNAIDQNWVAMNGYSGVGIVGYGPSNLSTHSNTLFGNRIGVDMALNPMGNQRHGVAIGAYGGVVWGFAPQNMITANTIAHNGLAGVAIDEDLTNLGDQDASLNTITQNAIYLNGMPDPGHLGIDLAFEPTIPRPPGGVTANDLGDADVGPNDLVNFPVITSAIYNSGVTTVSGTHDTAGGAANVELFLAVLGNYSNHGQGASFLGSDTAPGATIWTVALTGAGLPGQLLTATTTDTLGNTSEFSANVPVWDENQQPDDYGDAPNTYLTLKASGGPVHKIVPGMYLGASVDGEPDGQPNANATGDDILDGNDDEDGVAFPNPLVPGQSAPIDITASRIGLIDAWIDFDGSGTFTGSEQILANALHPGGGQTVSFSFNVPAGASPGITTVSRVRYSTAGNTLPTGAANDGEVEDHEVTIEGETQQDLDFGDAPDAVGAPQYPTLLSNNGARHVISGIMLGNAVDPEPDGQPSAYANGDDLFDGSDDEDGVVFPSAIISGVPTTIQVNSISGGILQGWVDWNGNGSWADTGEQILTDVAIPAGLTTLNISVPNGATGGANGLTYARFRISSLTGLGDSGSAPDGEVEDYLIHLEPLKWLQIPEQGAEGVDVNNTQYMLGDDFLCTSSGPITDIHIWGSFLGDILPEEGPGGLIIDVSIWSDVPAGVDAPYSHPGDPLWQLTFSPGQYNARRIWTVQEGEWWHDPGTQNWQPAADKNIYQFDFYPSSDQAFIQQEGTIYWLAVKYAYEGESDFQFGWKTTPEPWNDDACYFDPAGAPPFWQEMVYLPPHPWWDPELEMESVNLAFALSGGEGLDTDWGDAPDSSAAPGYPTLQTNNGARHSIDSLFMGATVDAEPDGLPNPTSTGDDITGTPDEDGVSFLTPLVAGRPVDIQVIVSASGVLDAWIDMDGDGAWSQPNEWIIPAIPVNPGDPPLRVTLPKSNMPRVTFARFRVSHGGTSPVGFASGGEVEDYQVAIGWPVQAQATKTSSPATLVLNWPTIGGTSLYTVYSSTNLATPFPIGWTLETPVPPGVTTTTWSETITVPRKFYGVVAWP